MKENYSRNKQLLINMGAQLMSFFINVGIGFFLTPYIVETIGSTAYGFVGLANNFVGYVQILTIALNSMAGRFIAIKYYKEDYEDVQKYYTSVLFANLLVSFALTIPSVLIVAFVNRIVNVPDAILPDVRLLWALIFLNMLISIVGSIFNNAAYVKNRLELISLRSIESNIIRVVLLIGCFAIFIPKVWYIGFASMISTVYTIVVNIYYTKKLMPFVKIKRKYFDFAKVKELVSSGVWNSISQLGGILSSGLDLLITNIFVGAEPMGVVSVSKTIPTYVFSLFQTVSSVFAPQLTISFAKNDKDDMIGQLKFAMKLMSLFSAIPLAFFVAYGNSFYSLWVPSQDAKLLTILTLLAMVNYPSALLMRPLYNVFPTANKVKVASLVTIASSFISCAVVFCSLYFTKNDIVKMIIIVGTSSICSIIRDVFVISPYCAKILNVSTRIFYAIILRSVASTAVLCCIALIIGNFFAARGWLALILLAALIGILGVVVSVFVMLNSDERKRFILIVKNKLSRRKQAG